MKYCPECGAEYSESIAACPECRAILVDEPPGNAQEPVVVQKVPDVVAAALLIGLLEHEGIQARLRGTELACYPCVPRDWSTTSWGEILVRRDELVEARTIISDYLGELDRGGSVRDEDVEGEAESESR